MIKNLKRLDLIFKNEQDTEAILEKTLARSNDEIVNDLIASGLKGRGGAGFPTGLKWRLAADDPADEKYIICNADEGDPGAYMNRNEIESDPHSIIEGMMIGAYIQHQILSKSRGLSWDFR